MQRFLNWAFRRGAVPDVRASDVAWLIQRVSLLEHQRALMQCDLGSMRARLRKLERKTMAVTGTGPEGADG